MSKVKGRSKRRFGVKVLGALALLTILLFETPVSATAYYPLNLRSIVTSKAPNVLLQLGNDANATIFTNSTSARVTTPTLNYPSGYNIVTGTYSSGTVPGSVNAVDSNYFVTIAQGGNSHITPSGSSTASLPSSQQRVFQNSRGQKAYYAFYRDTVSTTDKCWYAYSPDGVTWTVDQDTTLSAGVVSCSVVLREDPANSRSLIYLAASPLQTTVGGLRDIFFIIGTISDSGTTISWGAVQTVDASASTENQGYPTITSAADGFLHIAYAYTRNAGGAVNDRQNVVVCSSQTANPTSNPTWTCSDPTTNNPFTVESTADIELLASMPHVVPFISGNDILVIKGDCGGTETLSCANGADEVERTRVLNWDGTTQTWGNSASFTFPAADPPADERSAVVNATSGRVHYYYQDRGTTSNLVSSYLDSPYNAWSATTTVFSGNTDGNHLTITVHGSVKRLFAFYVKSSDGDLYSKNATDTQSWSAEQTQYTNSTTAARWVSSPASVNSTSLSFIPLIWVQQAGTGEVWFKRHSLTGQGTGASTEFTFNVSSATPLQLNFTIVQQYTSGSLSVTVQVYNYTGSAYPTSGQGYQTYTSSATPNTDETQSLAITQNPQFYTQSGQTKIKITGQLSGAAFNQKVNLVRLHYYQQQYGTTTPTVNYPTGYNIVAGAYSSGTVPGSVNAVDSDYFTTTSATSTAKGITSTASSTATLPESQQGVFRNTRGTQNYYTFYRDTVSTVDRCYYAYSNDGTTWTTDQAIGLSASFVSCSAIFREDAGNSQSVVYLTAGQNSTTASAARDIVFVIGTIADSGSTISWGTVQIVFDAGASDNAGYPAISLAANGFLHITFAYATDPNPGTTNDRQEVRACSSNTVNPTTNPTWTCGTVFTYSANNIQTLEFAPLSTCGLNGRDCLIIENKRNDATQRSKYLDWDGTTQTFQGTAATFSRTSQAVVVEVSSVANRTSGRVHLVYDDGSTNGALTRYIDGTAYNTWSSSSTVFAGAVDGVSLTITTSGSTKRLFTYYIKNSNGDIYTKNATDIQSWGSEVAFYVNSTTAAKWVLSQRTVNSTTFSSIPVIWVQQAATAELWFKTHQFAGLAETEFTFSVTTSAPSKLDFTIVHGYTIGSATVTIRVYNYTGASYPTSGQGYLTYTSSATPNTDETKALTITTNPQHYTSAGAVKVKITGQMTGGAGDQKVNLAKLDYYLQSFTYVLKVVNLQATSYQIRLNAQGLTQSNIARLSNFTAWLHDGTASVQLQILSGSFSSQTGPLYTLSASASTYLVLSVTATSSGTSTVDTYLQIYEAGTTTHTDYRITFKIT